MKWNGPSQKSKPKEKVVKKILVLNCFTGEQREVNRRDISIVDGMELGNDRVLLDNGVRLAVVGDGKYHTLGNPKQRWAEVAEVRVLPDGEYADGELLGWTPLFLADHRPTKRRPAARKEDKPAPKQGRRHPRHAAPAADKDKPEAGVAQADSAAFGQKAPEKLPARPKRTPSR